MLLTACFATIHTSILDAILVMTNRPCSDSTVRVDSISPVDSEGIVQFVDESCWDWEWNEAATCLRDFW